MVYLCIQAMPNHPHSRSNVSGGISRSRKSQMPRDLFRFSVMAMALTSAFCVQAAPALPNAGSLDNQLRQQRPVQPAAPTGSSLLTLPASPSGNQSTSDSHATVMINRVQFLGLENLPVTEEQLQKVVSGYINTPQRFSGLQKMVLDVTTVLRDQDLPLAQAILPPQTVSDGVLQIQIIPGHYDQPVVTNNSKVRDSVLQRVVNAGISRGELVRRSQLEKTALLLNNIPGVESSVVLQPGSQPGTSSASIEAKSSKAYGGYVVMDNYGDSSTGRGRLITGGYINELFGFGDLLQVNLLGAYEKLGIVSSSADYSVLATGYGTRLGTTLGHLRYSYKLSQLDFSGYSTSWSAYLAQPWIQTPRARIEVRTEIGQQFYTDNYPKDTPISNGKKTASTGNLTFQGSVATTPGGVTSFSLRGTLGSVEYQTQDTRMLNTAGGDGGFSRLNYYFTHQQPIWGPLSAFTSFKGQLTGRNLDSSQKLLLGGPDAVRAYDTGSGPVDNGSVLSAELKSLWHLPLQLAGGSPELTLAAFYDLGYGQQYKDNHNPQTGSLLANKNSVTLSGTGVYASLTQPGNYAVTLTWAQRTGKADPISGRDDRGRIWLSAVKTF